MKRLSVGVNKAVYVSQQGNMYIAEKINNVWLFKGRGYASPFEAFKEIDYAEN